jgi:integrase/recombinase XerD
MDDDGDAGGIDALVNEWVKWMRGRGMAERTVTERQRVIRHVAATTGEYAGAFTSQTLSGYLAAQNKPGTRGTYHATLRAYHLWLRKVQRLRPDDPMEDIGAPIVPRRTPHPTEDAHMEAILATRMKRRTRTAILLANFQGLRVHEVAKHRGEFIDLVGGQIFVCGKGGVEEWLPLHPAIRAEAESGHYPRHGWWFPSHKYPTRPVSEKSISTIISQTMRRAGVPGTAHWLRHRFGTELIVAGVDARTAQTLLRHASLQSTAIYTKISREQQKAGIEKLVWQRPA